MSPLRKYGVGILQPKPKAHPLDMLLDTATWTLVGFIVYCLFQLV